MLADHQSALICSSAGFSTGTSALMAARPPALWSANPRAACKPFVSGGGVGGGSFLGVNSIRRRRREKAKNNLAIQQIGFRTKEQTGARPRRVFASQGETEMLMFTLLPFMIALIRLLDSIKEHQGLFLSHTSKLRNWFQFPPTEALM